MCLHWKLKRWSLEEVKILDLVKILEKSKVMHHGIILYLKYNKIKPYTLLNLRMS